MGFTKWLARRGAVGGTARWAANGYRFFRQRHPDCDEFNDSSIFRLMIVHRYQIFPNADREEFLLSVVDQIPGLFSLTRMILVAEAGFSENAPHVKQMFSRVIVEELERKGMPHEVIFGPEAGAGWPAMDSDAE